jgi:hypothetical protein
MTRLTFAEDEKEHTWLSLVLDACAVVDEGVRQAVEGERRKSGRELACRKGCDACCSIQRDIPVYPHEMMGIYWYCAEKIKQPTLRLQDGKRTSCPFLLDGACVVHPLRPTGCRQFNVFGTPCAEGEDPYHTRRKDVVTPDRAFAHRAFGLVLSLYGVDDTSMGDKEKRAAAERVIHSQVVNLQTFDWGKLAERMREGPGP